MERVESFIFHILLEALFLFCIIAVCNCRKIVKCDIAQHLACLVTTLLHYLMCRKSLDFQYKFSAQGHQQKH